MKIVGLENNVNYLNKNAEESSKNLEVKSI